MRRLGYHFQKKDNQRLAFLRPLGENRFPRFHLFLEAEGNDLIFNLHLDQKSPIYKSAPAHSGESKSEVIEKEINRIKQGLDSEVKG